MGTYLPCTCRYGGGHTRHRTWDAGGAYDDPGEQHSNSREHCHLDGQQRNASALAAAVENGVTSSRGHRTDNKKPPFFYYNINRFANGRLLPSFSYLCVSHPHPTNRRWFPNHGFNSMLPSLLMSSPARAFVFGRVILSALAGRMFASLFSLLTSGVRSLSCVCLLSLEGPASFPP